MKALQQISTRAEFDPLIAGFKRAHWLTEKSSGIGSRSRPMRSARPPSPPCIRPFAAAMTIIARHGHRAVWAALDVLVRMKGPIDDFFNAVMVNAEDPLIRGNRLSLLKEVDDLFMSFADFSQIVVQGT